MKDFLAPREADFDEEFCSWLHEREIRDTEHELSNQGIGDCFVSEVQCEEVEW